MSLLLLLLSLSSVTFVAVFVIAITCSILVTWFALLCIQVLVLSTMSLLSRVYVARRLRDARAKQVFLSSSTSRLLILISLHPLLYWCCWLGGRMDIWPIRTCAIYFIRFCSRTDWRRNQLTTDSGSGKQLLNGSRYVCAYVVTNVSNSVWWPHLSCSFFLLRDHYSRVCVFDCLSDMP